MTCWSSPGCPMTTIDDIDALLTYLDGVGRPRTNHRGVTNWSARCPVPAHDDRHPSLRVGWASPGQLLLFCLAGCRFEAILEALRARGYAPRQTFAYRPASEKERLQAQLREMLRRAGHDPAHIEQAVRDAWDTPGKALPKMRPKEGGARDIGARCARCGWQSYRREREVNWSEAAGQWLCGVCFFAPRAGAPAPAESPPPS
jgi:hypothetical protein